MNKKELFESKFLSTINYNTNDLQINYDKGIIYKVSVCSKGEARGHGINLDESFIQDLLIQGEKTNHGVKCRFGHPNPYNDAIGTLIGVFRNFKVSEDSSQIYADLYLSESAKKSPHGNLFDYTLSLAEHHPKHFGTSIVNYDPKYFQYDKEGNKKELTGYDDYNPNEEIFMKLGAFEACDLVDSPAANPAGLFSTTKNKKMNIKESIRKFFNDPENTDPKKKDPENMDPKKGTPLEVGKPEKGNECKFMQDEKEYLLPDGELFVSSGEMEGKVIIIKEGKVSEIQDPEMDVEQAESLSANRIKGLPVISQLHIINSRLQKELDRTPAAAASTAVNEQDREAQSAKFQSDHFSSEVNSIKRFQTKK
jgi:hypothetical protein